MGSFNRAQRIAPGGGAADLLGQTRAVVSFNIKRLEAELGVTLLTRNTRRLAREKLEELGAFTAIFKQENEA